ncbi:MAG: hypothetical protein PHW82_05635 [Bacteroidales bacterium]|nr:hypothetical protein [Bacteroidales bacterium]
MKSIEINEFDLYYDGIYEISFGYNNLEKRLKVFLSPDMIIKLLHNEGMIEKLYSSEYWIDPIKISNTTIIIKVANPDADIWQIRTSEYADGLMCSFKITIFDVQIKSKSLSNNK